LAQRDTWLAELSRYAGDVAVVLFEQARKSAEEAFQ
jgi:hypothetical protein